MGGALAFSTTFVRCTMSSLGDPADVKAAVEGESGVHAEGEDAAKAADGDGAAKADAVAGGDADADAKAKEDEIKDKKAKRVKRKEEKDAAKKQEASESVVKENLIANAINKHADAINNLASSITNLADIFDPADPVKLQNVLGQLPGNIAKDVAPGKAVKDVVSGVGASGSGRKLTQTQHYTPDEVEPATKKQRGRPRGSTVNPK